MPLNKLPLQKGQSIELAGEDMGAGVLYFFIFGTEVYVADTPGQILDALAQGGIKPPVDRAAISHLLHHSVVPVPSTCLTGLYVLSVGDRAFLIATDSGIELSFVNDFPYLEQRSSGRSAPETQRLLDRLTHAVQEVGRGGDSIALLMSAGKDSVPLALALAEAGLRDSVCITYRPQLKNESESSIAADFCGRLGLKHRIVQCPMDQHVLRTELDNWFKAMPLPVVDPTSFAVLLCAQQERRPVLMDGTGSDVYFGYVFRPLRTLILNLSRATDRMPRLRAALCAIAEKGHRVFAPRSVLCLPNNLHPRKTASFFPDVVDTLPFWTEEAIHYHHLTHMDLERVMCRHFYEPLFMLKTRTVAAHMGASAVFPWCDARVIEYVFNLPAAARFNLETGLNKVLVRQLLRERLQYDDALIGKMHFANDNYILFNLLRDYILEHVSACRLWNRSAVDLARRYLNITDSRPRLRPLFTLFVVSAWFNLSRYAATISEAAWDDHHFSRGSAWAFASPSASRLKPRDQRKLRAAHHVHRHRGLTAASGHSNV
jgi:Asparagine synthase